MKIWELKKGWTFKMADQPDVEFIFLGMDGMYAQVRALDPDINKRMCAHYDSEGNFFCIMPLCDVTPVTPEAFKCDKEPEIMSDNPFQVVDTPEGGENGSLR